ncbi:7453_t:CDS:2, partial [Dentiscutata heterogama]
MVEKEIINISIKLFWNVNDSSATFVRPLEFTTVLNHGCTTIKDLDEPDTILLNGNSYKKIVDSDIHDLKSPINNVSLEEVQANYVENTEKNHKNEEELMHDDLQEPLDENEELILDDSISSQEPLDSQNNQENEELMLNQSNNHIDFQDNQ